MKHFFQKTEPATTQQYVADLDARLRWQLPPGDTMQVRQEVEAHFADQVADLTMAGLSRDEAQRQAIAGFGPARTYARRILQAAYGAPLLQAARGAAFCAASLLTVFTPLLTVARIPLPFLLLPLGTLLAVGALGAKTPQTGRLVRVALLATVLVGLAGGTFWTYGSRGILSGDLAEVGQRYDTQRDTDRIGVPWLTAGVEAARTGKPFPAFLRTGNGYIVPRAASRWTGFEQTFGTAPLDAAHRSASKDVAFVTVDSDAKARAAWRTRGTRLLPQATASLAQSTQKAARFRAEYLGPRRFSVGAAFFFAYLTLLFAVPVIGADAALAFAGRAAYVLCRSYRLQRIAA